MTDEKTQQPLGVASDLNAELGTFPQYKPTDYDPFSSDFGECGDITFSDKMVKSRKEYVCGHCKGDIKNGEIHRNLNAKIEGQLMSYRWCADCCAAMVLEMAASECKALHFQSRINLFAS